MDGASAGASEHDTIVAGVAVNFSTAFHWLDSVDCGAHCRRNSFPGRALPRFVAVLGENDWSFGKLHPFWRDSLALGEFDFADFLGGALDFALSADAESSGADCGALPLQLGQLHPRALVVNEREIIEVLAADLPINENTVIGAGDDCAAVRLPAGEETLLLKTDAVVEGVHFTRNDPPQCIGRKALARCLSDLASMGGRPDSALVSLGLPSSGDVSFLREVYRGLRCLAEKFGVAVVGGETTRCPGAFFLSITLTGYADSQGGVRRSGARVGDAIFVSGRLGGSRSGRHLNFEPRINEARWLAEHFRPHAMIDVSDGLAADLKVLLRASKVGARMDEAFIPVSEEAKRRFCDRVSKKPPLLAALTDGEDFELLFTLAPDLAVAVKDDWRARFPRTPLSLIGRVESGFQLRWKQNQGDCSLKALHGYDHFQQR